MSVIPGFIYFQQGRQSQLNAGAIIRYLLNAESNYTGFEKGRAVGLGAHFRAGDALIVSALAEAGPFEFGISYDVNISGLNNVSSGRGGMEVALRYIAKKTAKQGSSRRY
jgi:hypothetical protein